MIKVAEDSLNNNPELKKVTKMNHAPRYDHRDTDPVGLKPNLAIFANNYLLELWLQSPLKNKIHIGIHNLECTGEVRRQRFTDVYSGMFDGVHMYSEHGREAYMRSVLDILRSSFEITGATPRNIKPSTNDA